MITTRSLLPDSFTAVLDRAEAATAPEPAVEVQQSLAFAGGDRLGPQRGAQDVSRSLGYGDRPPRERQGVRLADHSRRAPVFGDSGRERASRRHFPAGTWVHRAIWRRIGPVGGALRVRQCACGERHRRGRDGEDHQHQSDHRRPAGRSPISQCTHAAPSPCSRAPRPRRHRTLDDIDPGRIGSSPPGCSDPTGSRIGRPRARWTVRGGFPPISRQQLTAARRGHCPIGIRERETGDGLPFVGPPTLNNRSPDRRGSRALPNPLPIGPVGLPATAGFPSTKGSRRPDSNRGPLHYE